MHTERRVARDCVLIKMVQHFRWRWKGGDKHALNTIELLYS